MTRQQLKPQQTGTSLAEAIRALGEGQASQRQGTPMQQRISQMAMLQNMNGNQLGGYALGKVLQAILSKMISNYDKRGQLKSTLSSMTPEEREKFMEGKKQDDNYGWYKEHYDRWFGNQQPNSTPQSDASGLSPAAIAAADKVSPVPKLLSNEDELALKANAGDFQQPPLYESPDLYEDKLKNIFGDYSW